MVTGEPVSRETFAEVIHEGPRNFLAWCPACSDGGRSHQRRTAELWAFKHNKEQHDTGA